VSALEETLGIHALHRASLVFALVLGFALPTPHARGETQKTTVAQFAALDKTQQSAVVQSLSNDLVARLSERSAEGQPAPESERRREIANLVRALLLRGSTGVSDSIFGSVVYQAKKTAETNPSADVMEALIKTVGEYADRFQSANLAGSSDLDQQAYFLKSYVEFNVKDQAEFNKHMDAIIEEEKKQAKRIEASRLELQKQRVELDCKTIRLHDGRRVYVDGDHFQDENGRILEGADEEEAQQFSMDFSKPADLQKYNECLSEHGIATGDLTDRDAAPPATAAAPPVATAAPVAIPSAPPRLEFSEPEDDPFGGDGGFIKPAPR